MAKIRRGFSQRDQNVAMVTQPGIGDLAVLMVEDLFAIGEDIQIQGDNVLFAGLPSMSLLNLLEAGYQLRGKVGLSRSAELD